MTPDPNDPRIPAKFIRWDLIIAGLSPAALRAKDRARAAAELLRHLGRGAL